MFSKNSTTKNHFESLQNEIKFFSENELSKALIEDIQSIYNFLMDEKQVVQCLLFLEKILKHTLTKNNFINENIPNHEYKKGTIKHFRKMLTAILIKFGNFQQDQYSVQIIGELSSPVFNTILKNKWFMKDSFFRYIEKSVKEHGEYTHMIQLCLVALAMYLKLIKLNHSLSEMYSNCGKISYVMNNTIDNKPESLWYLLFDQNPDNQNSTLFRCPEFITNKIRNSISSFSTLNFLLFYRSSNEYELILNKNGFDSSTNNDENLEEKINKKLLAKLYLAQQNNDKELQDIFDSKYEVFGDSEGIVLIRILK